MNNYTVQNGDSLSSIAYAFKIPTTDIMKANNMQYAEIQPGQTLILPGNEESEPEMKEMGGVINWRDIYYDNF